MSTTSTMLADDRQTNDDSTPTPAQVSKVIGAVKKTHVRTWILRAALLLGLILVGWAIAAWQIQRTTHSGPRYSSLEVRRGDLNATVTATGNLQALDQVDVGAEVSGRVISVLVDFNDQVEEGQVLCELDSSQFVASRNQARAQLRVAEADLENRLATRAEAELLLARTRALAAVGVSAKAEVETAEAALTRARAALSSARAQISFTRAALELAETSLAKTKIRSPINGIVLERAVEPGQTLAATLAAPKLFTLARNLRQMELHIDIDEADVGRVREGQAASFVVDAYPHRFFPADLASIHNIAATLENVVTYEALLLVSNDDLVLRPGMTATVTITTEKREGALLVPNAALRFTPPSEIPADRAGPPNPFSRSRPASGATAGKTASDVRARVWILRPEGPVSVPIEAGLSDGEWTEVVTGPLHMGDEVLVDVVVPKSPGGS